MEERRVADYFVVAGMPAHPNRMDDVSQDSNAQSKAPITDLAVIFPPKEEPPDGFTLLEFTPTGIPADLNHGSFRSQSVYLCYRRGYDKPPLVDIGVLYEGKEKIMPDSEIIEKSPTGMLANVNNSSAGIFVTYRRAPVSMPCNELVVTDICVIMKNKEEAPPNAFCMIRKSLNKGVLGSDVYLCYKKSMNRANLISYKPEVLTRYPRLDLPSFPFPSSVPMFCLPMGTSLEYWPAKAQRPRPVFSTFVLTVSDASEKVYGSAVTFYERYPAEKVTPQEKKLLQVPEDEIDEESTFNVNKAICILSHWPFFDTFERFLNYLYNMTGGVAQSVPIERYISFLLEDVPFPSPQRPQLLIQLTPEQRLILTQPEDLPLPRSGARFSKLLVNLAPENCLVVLLCALTEQKLLVHSLRPDVLTGVAEAISIIIFPFKWQCPYIPLCPLGLAEVLHAPLPFLIGVDSRFFDLHEPPIDVICVDLDTNNIIVCEEKRNLTAKLLPKRPARALLSTLEQLHRKVIQTTLASGMQDPAKENCIDKDFQNKRKEQALELEIQEAFLRFMATILKGYRDHLLPITKAPTIGTTDPNSLFDLTRFLRSRDKSHHKFFSMVMKTQMFIRFIEERSFVSDMDAGLAFFDECTERVSQDENIVGRLVELDDNLQNERTIYIMPPEPPPNATTVYCYDTFELNPQLFSPHDAKMIKVSSRLSGGLGLGIPGSPMARRTKHEVKSAQKLARKQATAPDMWAKCLLGTCYSIWFIHLPSYVMMNPQKAHSCLSTAYDLLDRVQKLNLQPTDEVCYRVMMQLCGVYSAPVLAVKLLFLMKRSGVQLNAITYGFYNRAVLEAQWPSDMRNSSQFLWNKLRKDLLLVARRVADGIHLPTQLTEAERTRLRNVIMGAALFRQAGSKGQLSRRVSSTCLVDGVTELAADGVSHASSVDSNNSSDLKPSAQTSHDDVRLKNGSQSDTGYSSTSDNVKEGGVPSVDRPEEVESSSLLDSEAGGAATATDVESKAVTSLKTDRGSVEGSRRTSTTVPPSNVAVSNSSIDSLALARFRSRIGSIVRPSSSTNLLAETDLTQQPFESSAGLLMTSRHDSRPMIAEEVQVNEDLISPLVDPKVGSPANPRRARTRSGSCSDFGFAPRLDKSPNIHPLTNSCKASGEPGSPVAPNPNENLKLLMRSESFAHDAGIISKLNKLAVCMGDPKARPNGPSDSQSSSNSRSVQNAFPKASSVSKALFGRRGSLGFRRSQQSESQESSTENLTERSVENSRGGSMDDLDSVSSQHATPTRRRLSGWSAQIGAHLGFSNWGSRENMPSPDQREASPVRSLPKSPARTPVVENDPLGALLADAEPEEEEETELGENGSENSVLNSALDEDGHPILFGGVGRKPKPPGDKGVSRSATFHDDDTSNAGGAVSKLGKSKSMQRSSTITMPVDCAESGSGGMAASIGSLGSSFKHPFSRYSPGRFSLRKSNLTFSPIIAAALSPNYATKKYPELITGLKSAANNMAKKLSELKESMTANNTPIKGASGLSGDCDGSLCEDDGVEGSQTDDAGSSRSRKVSSEFSLAVSQNYGEWKSNILDKLNYSNRKGSSSNLQPLGESNPPPQIPILPENLYPKLPNMNREPVAMKLLLTSCTRCHNCGFVLYDEEIMAGWSPEDSNLNTRCQFCKKATVPFLAITVIDNRSLPMIRPKVSQEASQESLHSSPLRKISTSLSPLSASVKRLTTSSSEINDSHASASASASESSEVTSPEMETAPSSPMTPTVEEKDEKREEAPTTAAPTAAAPNMSKVPEEPLTLEPITVPYLNPLVLRKELENILIAEGDVCLTRPCFVDEHPIIYWNMVWVINRIGVESHLPGLCLEAKSFLRQRGDTPIHPTWTNMDHHNVQVRCLWDNVRLHEEVGLPMYVLWEQDEQPSSLVSALLTERTSVSRGVMQAVVSGIKYSDLSESLKKLAAERQKMKAGCMTRTHSMYRDCLFLAFRVIGQKQILLNSFDSEYERAFLNLSEHDLKLQCDEPLSVRSLCCRHYFRELEL